jgi:uncharacterized membrane protein YidH (DUF202 family)
MNAPRLFDPGLQPERTLLAWGRTCLALAVVLAVIVKVMAIEPAGMLVVITVLGLALPVVAWALAVLRYRRVHRELTRQGAEPMLPAGGSAMLVATCAALVTGGLALVLVIR